MWLRLQGTPPLRVRAPRFARRPNALSRRHTSAAATFPLCASACPLRNSVSRCSVISVTSLSLLDPHLLQSGEVVARRRVVGVQLQGAARLRERLAVTARGGEDAGVIGVDDGGIGQQ